MSLRDTIFVVAFVPCLPFCFFRPFFGILMWTVVSLLNPHSFTWSMMTEFPWALAVAAPTLAGAVFYSPNWKGFFSREVGFVILLWGWFTFTSLNNSSMPIFSHFAVDTWFRWRVVSKIFCMTLATVLIVNTWDRFRLFLLVMSGCFAVLVLKAVPFMILTGGSFRLYGPRG